MKRLCFLLLCCLCFGALTGCSNSVMERQTFALCMSFDIDRQDRLTIAIQTPMNGSDSKSGAAPQYAVFSVTGETLDSAFALLSDATPCPLNFSQLKLCIISYELAAKRELRPMLQWLNRIPNMRPDAVVAIALGSAKDTMTAQTPDFGMRMSIHLNIYIDQMAYRQTSPVTTLTACLRDLNSGRTDPLLTICAVNPAVKRQNEAQEQPEGGGASGGESGSTAAFSDGFEWSETLVEQGLIAGSLPREGMNPVEYLGSAAVGNGRVSGLLTTAETQIVLRLKRCATLKIAEDGERLQLQLWLNPNSEGINAFTPEEVKKTVEKLQALHCDALGFGDAAAAMVYTDGDWEAFKLEQRYPSAEVCVASQ